MATTRSSIRLHLHLQSDDLHVRTISIEKGSSSGSTVMELGMLMICEQKPRLSHEMTSILRLRYTSVHVYHILYRKLALWDNTTTVEQKGELRSEGSTLK